MRINNVVRKARPALFAKVKKHLCAMCDDTGTVTDTESHEWPCPCCMLGAATYSEHATRDRKAEAGKAIWQALGDVPVDDNMNLMEPFFEFKAGASAEDVWHWIEQTFDVEISDAPPSKELAG
ncbi:hypothetical protein D3C87_616380 [compost metagenome]